MEHHNIVIIGAGPAGLALAKELRANGVEDVVVLEREAEAGGVPRHCGHRGFGLYNRNRYLTGPAFAKKLREWTEGLDVRTKTSVLEFTLRGTLRVHNAGGIFEMAANKFVLATGTRETSRAANLIGGNRSAGIINTGTLQQLVYLKGQRPFSQPVIIGSEWVSFSALLTCRHAHIKPVAMITEQDALDAPAVFGLGAKWMLGVPMIRNSTVIAIHGRHKVESVELESRGQRHMLACDGVIVTGKFRSENALYAGGYIESDNHAPKTTEVFRASRKNIFAVGNVLGRLETAGACMIEARKLAAILAKDAL